MVFALVVLREVQLDQRLRLHRLARDRTDLEVFQEVNYRLQFENVSILVTVRVLVRNHGQAAMIEGQTFELDSLLVCICLLVASVGL